MKIYVCVKQVPDTSGKVAVNPDGTLNRASMQTITNPDDMNAVEAALKLKDATGCKVTVVTMGPPPAAGMLRELMAMGADEGVLVSAREFGGSDTYATSQILAAALSTLGVEKDDIVMCGRQAIDGDTAQVGPQIAEKLHLPQVTYAADIKKDGDTITVQRMLEDVRVPASELLGRVNKGFTNALKTLDIGRIGIAAQSIGVAQGCLDEAVKYAKERRQFGRSIAQFQGISFMLAEMATKLEAAKELTYKAAVMRDKGLDTTMAASMAKYFASEACNEIAAKAVQIHGGYGYTKDYPMERMMRDAKITEIYEGTSEVQRIVISANMGL